MLDPDSEHAARLVNHWYWRPGHRPGRPFYTWHLTLEDQRGLHRLVSAYHSALDALPNVDLVPLRWLHLTMQGVGFVDEVDEARLTDIVAAARSRLARLAPLNVQFGPMTVRREALALYPRPAGPFLAVRSGIRAAIDAVTGAVPEPEAGYQPHLSLAYANADTDVQPVLDLLRGMTSVAPALATIRRVSLIELERDGHRYRWTPRYHVDLGDIES